MSNVSTAKFLTAVNAVNPPEFSDQPDELPRIGWRNGAKQARTGGFFYAKADDLLDRPAAPWEPVTIYDDEPGYQAKRLSVAVVSVRTQPFMPDTDASGKKHMRWLTQWEPGAQLYTEWLCFAEGLGNYPVILYSKGLTGKALADALRTFRAKVLKPAERIAGRRLPSWTFWMPLATLVNEKGAVMYTDTGHGSVVTPPALYLPSGDEIAILDALAVDETVLALGVSVREEYAAWHTEKRGNQPAPVAPVAPTPDINGAALDEDPNDYSDEIPY